MKKLLTIFIGSFLCIQARAQVPALLVSRFQDTLEDMRVMHHFKGLSAAVSFKGMGTWTSAVGVSDAATPLSPDMLIGIGSNTKTFVSAMMIKLSEAGKLDLGDTIGTWISGYPNINGKITIRQLLNHTSGLNNYTDNPVTWDSVNKDLSRMWTKEEILNKFVLAPYFAPGANWKYSNTNYIIAGMIEEQVLGVPVQQLLRDSIIAPLGLDHTYFPPYETASDPYAHLWTDFDGDGILDDVGEYATSTILPQAVNSLADAAGALVSTAGDNTRFWEALLKGHIISKTAVTGELMKWSGFGTASSDYGLGIFKSRVLGNTVFSHGGTWIGQINENLSDTVNNIFITVLSNQDGLKNDYVLKVVQALYKIALDYTKLDVAEAAGSTPVWKLYPNPAADMLYVDCPLQGAKQYRIYDLSGRLVKNLQGETLGGSVTGLDIAGLENGLYLLQLHTDQGVQSAKVLIRH